MRTDPALADDSPLTPPSSLVQRCMKSMRQSLKQLLSWRPSRREGAEILLLASALPLYYLVRGITATNVDESVQRGIALINVEKSLGIFWEVELQSWVLSYEWLLKVLNNFYLFGHLPVIGTLAVWLYFWHRPQYLFMRNAFLISGAIALMFYVNFPTAPPRLLPEALNFGFVDTVANQYQESKPLTPSWFVNEYAAFPSMHIGWNLLVGLAVWLATKNIFIRAFAFLMPLAMMADIVLTANHYIIDGIAALPVIFVAIAIAAGARWLVVRKFAPNGNVEREKGWVGWLYWIVGIPPGAEATNTLVPTPKAA